MLTCKIPTNGNKKLVTVDKTIKVYRYFRCDGFTALNIRNKFLVDKGS